MAKPEVARGVETASVIIVTYNRPDYVVECLDHLAVQTRAADQVIVVDSSPDSRTRQAVATRTGVLYLRNEAGRGTTATSRAIGVAHATGEVIVFVDDDAYAEPDWLEHLLAPYADASVGGVGGRALNNQPDEATTGLNEIGLLLPDGTLTGNFAADPGSNLEVDHLIGCNMSFRRSAIDSVGGIHDHFPGTCLREESDIALRIKDAGYRLIYTPKAVVLHLGGTYAKGRRFDLRYNYFGARNHVVLLSHVYGIRTPYLRRHGRKLFGDWGDELRGAARAMTDPGRSSFRSRMRGAGGGVARVLVSVAGTATGAVAAAKLVREHPAHG